MPAGVRRAAWLLGAIALAGVALRPRFGDEIFVTRYTGYVMPWLVLGLVPGALWAWATGSRALSSLLAISGALVVGLHVPHLWRGGAAPPPPTGFQLRVMSYNTWSRNTDARRIAGVILAERPDLLLLQEIREHVFGALLPELRDLYGGSAPHAVYDPSIGQAVVSRYPLRQHASMRQKGRAQQVVVHSPAGAITVFNVHPLRTGGWRQRYDQIATLLEEDLLPERSPVILGGDLNVTEHSQMYALLSTHLLNAHRAARRGFGFTYPAALHVGRTLPALPMARIDHLFLGREFVAVRAGTLAESGGSDHRPVFAEVILRASAPARPSGEARARPR